MLSELERLPAHSVGHAELAARYNLTTAEINERARVAWSRAIQEESMQYDTRARLLAVEVLLTDPEALGNDALETDLYLPGVRLQEQPIRFHGPSVPRSFGC
jgi:hypothetical protein